MVVYVLRTEIKSSVRKWVEETNSRLEQGNMFKSPFTGAIKIISCEDCLLLVSELTPLYPNFSIFGWLSGLGIFLVWGLSLWLIPCGVIALAGIFWSSHFYYFFNKTALRKFGYGGSVNRLKLDEFIKEVIF